MSSSDHHKKSKKKRSRRHTDADDNDDYPDAPRKSLVDYSKVSERPSHPSVASNPTASMAPANAPTTTTAAATAPAAPAEKMSSQMQAVVRLMTGQAERTIQEKLADSNRPTWEQYKKDNHDKLNLEGVDQKEMEEYRKSLDTEREGRLARGTNHKDKKKKKKRRQDDSSSGDSDDDDSDDSRRRRRKHKKHKKEKKHKRSKKESRREKDDDSANESEDDSRRKRHKKKRKKKKDEAGDGDSDGSAYRLSNFFTQGSDDDA
jgi:hypothetical protein